jgi:hypothetical protein
VKQKFDPRQPSLFEEVTPIAEPLSKAEPTPPGALQAEGKATGLEDDRLPCVSLPGRDSLGQRQFILVPHATFLAWPESVQWRYCAARDRASATEADNEKEREWYLQRAETYEQAAYNAPVPF